jgi:hypothetical protein
MKWSFSGLKDFDNCARQFNEVKNLKNYVKQTTQQMLYGTEVHKALEDYARDGTPLLKNYERFQRMIDELMEIPGARYPERQMALKVDRLTPCAFDDPEYWVRGIVDLLIIDGDTAFIVDYKTGSAKYPDTKQLKLMAIFTFAHHPEVMHVKAGLLFVMHNVFIDETYTRQQTDTLWQSFVPTLSRLEIAEKSNVWMPNPSPLCGWCPVKSCQYHGER